MALPKEFLNADGTLNQMQMLIWLLEQMETMTELLKHEGGLQTQVNKNTEGVGKNREDIKEIKEALKLKAEAEGEVNNINIPRALNSGLRLTATHAITVILTIVGMVLVFNNPNCNPASSNPTPTSKSQPAKAKVKADAGHQDALSSDQVDNQ